MRLSILTLAAVSLCTAAHLQAQDQTDRSDENWKAVCKSAQATPLLIEPPAGPLSASQLPSCDEQALYYGPGGKPNYAQPCNAAGGNAPIHAQPSAICFMGRAY